MPNGQKARAIFLQKLLPGLLCWPEREGQELPSYVYAPVFHDKDAESNDWKKRPVYRKLEKIDETICDVSNDDYLKYWGLFYTGQEEQCKVYEVRTKTLINADLQSVEFGTF